MALRKFDSFDHYASADVNKKCNVADTAGIETVGRNGTSGLSSGFGGFVKDFFDNQPTWIAGRALKFTNIPSNNAYIFQFLDNNTIQVSLNIQSDGNLNVQRNGTILNTTSGLSLQANQFYFIEFKATINNAGSYEVRVNGVNVLSGSADTQETANAYADVIACMQPSGVATDYTDDYYICDGTGAENNDFLGDRKAVAVMPDAAGAHSDWTGSSGSDHYTLVDENPPTGDSDYVETLTTNAKETYSFQPITDTGTISGVQLNLCIRKTDATARTCRHIAIVGGTQYNGTNFTCNDTYTYARYIWQVNPDTGVAWTKDEINASEFGVEFIS